MSKFDDRIVELVGAALRIEQYAQRLVVLAEGLYERAITIAVATSDERARNDPGACEGPVKASEEEHDDRLGDFETIEGTDGSDQSPGSGFDEDG